MVRSSDISVFRLKGLRQTKINLRAYADSDGPDQTAYSLSLIRVFAVC